MKLADFSIRKPATIIILLAGVILFGLLSLRGMRQDLITTITMPQIMAYTIYPGASPSDIEDSITRPFEDRLSQVSGVVKIESDSMKSVSFVIVTCGWDVDLNQMKGEVESRVKSIKLPDGVMAPQVVVLNSNMLPIISMKVAPGKVPQIDSVTGKIQIDPETGDPVLRQKEFSTLQITQFLDDNLIQQLQKISGVSKVSIKGGAEQELAIRLDMDKVQAKEISILNIFKILKYSNMNLPAGTVTYEGKSLSFRTEGKFNSIEDIRNMTIDFKEDERTFIRLRDVADVSIVEVAPDHYAEYDSEPIILVEVEKLPSGDTVKIIKKVKELCSSVEEKSGNLVTFSPILDSSKDIGAAISNVKNAAVMGAMLAILVIFMFLHNIRTTIIVGLSIPLSVIIAFVAMKLMGLNLNLMTLGGMTVAIGMIVDSSIVVLENTYNHFLEHGDRKKAASVGADEVGGAVVASIATSLAVFIPILTLSGLVGAILKDISMTIVFALGASLIVSLMVVPFLSSLMLKMPDPKPRTFFGRGVQRIAKVVEGSIKKLTEWYGVALKGALDNRVFILIIAVIILLTSLFTVKLVGFEFLDAPDMGEFEIVVKTPSGTSMEETREKMRMINDEVKDLLGRNLKSGMFVTGLDPKYDVGGNATVGLIRIRLVDSKKRDKGMSIFEIMPLLQEEIPKRVPDVDIAVNNGGIAKMLSYATGGSGFVVNVTGSDFDEIAKIATDIAAVVDQHPSVYKTELNVNLNEKELVSKLDLANLGALGISPFEAAVSELIVFQGMDAGSMNYGGDDLNIRLESNLEGAEIGRDTLNRVPVQNQAKDFVTMAVLTDLVEESSADKIPHVNRMRSITVTGLVDDGSDISQDVRPALDEIVTPVGVEWEISGSSDLLAEVIPDLIMVMIIAVFLVYAVMVIQFQRFIQPLIVMASVPFVLIGCTLALLISGINLSLVAMLGLIALAGMVVNNAIVLIDYTNLLRTKYNRNLDQAVLESGKSRLKPILMTTMTTALGVFPMMLANAEGSELYKPLGWVIFGGLITSTMITLFLIPVLYHIVEGRRDKRIAIKEAAMASDDILEIEEKEI